MKNALKSPSRISGMFLILLVGKQAEKGMNIYLIGYRCTGKSSVGKLLASNLGMKFTDTDAELVTRCGRSISEFVGTSGWDEFRKVEKNIIRELSAMNNQVVATGGGAALDPDNSENMKKTGIVVWLRAKPSTIRERILKDKGTKDFRPSLTGKGTIEEIEEVLSARSSFYEKAMDFYIDTDDMDVNDVCRIIITHYEAIKIDTTKGKKACPETLSEHCSE
jgi:shikimate kinase